MSKEPVLVTATHELRESVDGLHGAVLETQRLLAARLPPPRQVDFTAVRKPVHGAHGLLLLLRVNPSMAADWAKQVPQSHLQDGAVRCTCGETVELGGVGAMVDCPGCDRHFLTVENGARVARWPDEPVPDRYAGPGWTP